jgi:hypothetical protein
MLTSSIVVGICSALAPQMGHSISWLRWLRLMRARPRRSHTIARGLLPPTSRHLHGTNGLAPTVSSPPISESHPPANFGPAGACQNALFASLSRHLACFRSTKCSRPHAGQVTTSEATPALSDSQADHKAADRRDRVAVQGADIDRSTGIATGTIDVQPRRSGDDCAPDSWRP